MTIDYIRKDGQDIGLSAPEIGAFITDYSINGQTLIAGHPVHPATGVLTELPLNNEFTLSFQDTGDYEIRLSLQAEELSDGQRLIFKAKITFNYTVDP